MKNLIHQAKRAGVLLILASAILVTAPSALAIEKATGVSATGTHIKGFVYNTFNRFTNNLAQCEQSKRVKSGVCEDAAYMDEREFVRLRYVGRVNPDTLVSISDESKSNNPKHLNYTETLQEGDVLRAYVYVHNNAKTIPDDSRYQAYDVRSSLSIVGNKVLGTIQAKNAYFNEPTAAQTAMYDNKQVPQVEATFQDEAFVTLPSGMSLALLKSSAGNHARIDGCLLSSDGASCTETELVKGPILNNSKVTVEGSTLTYRHGTMVGSRPNAYTMVVDLIVTNAMGVAVTPPCSNVNYEANFRIFNPSSKNVIYVSSDPNWETSKAYFSKSIPNLSEVKGPIGFDGNASGGKFRPERTYYWGVHNGTSMYHGTPFKAPLCDTTPEEENNETPGSYPLCVLGTPVYRLVWDKATSGDTLTLEHTRKGSTQVSGTYTYTVYSKFGSVQTTSLRNSSGQALALTAGDSIRWKVGSSQWYQTIVQDCQNGVDGLRIDLNRLPVCAAPTYNPIFLWNTPGATKQLDVSTDPTFTTFYTKNISNLTTTTGPAGFVDSEGRTNRVLSFQGDITYYWRIREGGKIYPGQPFRVPKCVDVECDDNGYTGPDDQCIDGEIVPTPVPPGTPCTVGVCACVEIDVDPGSAGDFNTATFKTTVSNQTTGANKTVSRRIEVYNRDIDKQKAYSVTFVALSPEDGTCVNGVSSKTGKPCDSSEQGSFDMIPTSIKAVPRVGANRSQYSDAASNPIKVELEEFQANQNKPIIVRNLYPGDEVDIYTTGLVRTSKAGKEFAPETQAVNYNLFMSSQSNGGVKALTIARPFLLTINDGDLLKSFALKGLISFDKLLKDVTGYKPVALSGVDQNTPSPSIGKQSLGFGSNLSGLTVLSNSNKIAGSSITLSSEADMMSRMNIRPDKTRIFSAQNQDVVFGSLSQPKVELGERSTMYVKFTGGKRGTVTINSNIQYKTGSQTPSFALVVENGDIVIHPSVTQLDGVFVVLGTGKIKGDANWKSYYEAGGSNVPKPLVVNGALYGDIQELIPSRPNSQFSKTDKTSKELIEGSGIAINFDGRVYSFPPPGLKEIVGGVYELLREAK